MSHVQFVTGILSISDKQETDKQFCFCLSSWMIGPRLYIHDEPIVTIQHLFYTIELHESWQRLLFCVVNIGVFDFFNYLQIYASVL